MDDENPTTYADLPSDLNNDKLPFFKGAPPPPPSSSFPAPPPPSSYAPPPGYSYAGQPPPGYVPSGYAPVIYVEDSSGFYAPQPRGDVVVLVSSDDDGTRCALCGLCFSWMIIVGWITFCVNISAPAGSRRRRYAQMACGVATSIFILNIIFYYTWY